MTMRQTTRMTSATFRSLPVGEKAKVFRWMAENKPMTRHQRDDLLRQAQNLEALAKAQRR